MKKIKVAVVILLCIGITLGLIFFLIGLLKPKVAGIFIDSNPVATVYIDGQNVGKTPYRATRTPGEVTIRLIPDNVKATLFPYDTKVDLNNGVETVVRRQFGTNDDTSSGEIISFEKTSDSDTSLAVVTTPDSLNLTIDGIHKLTTPQKLSGLTPGRHTLNLAAVGFQTKDLDVNIYQGYKLTVIVKLAKKTTEVQVSPTPTPIANTGPQVEISQTPTGYLRVRSEPSTLGNEVGRVVPGIKYNLIETDAKSGWFKIEFSEGQSGWISNQFAKRIPVASSSAQQPSSELSPQPTQGLNST